jgi:hypothetical protein
MTVIPRPHSKLSTVEFILHIVFILAVISTVTGILLLGQAFSGNGSTAGVLDVVEKMILPVAVIGLFVTFTFPALLALGIANIVLATIRIKTKRPIPLPWLQWIFIVLEVIVLIFAAINLSHYVIQTT